MLRLSEEMRLGERLARTADSFSNGVLRLATLGPGGTSSESAARYLMGTVCQGDRKGIIELYPTFETAAEAVVEEPGTALVVANAYAKINVMYMDPGLKLVGAFVQQTPAYGLAKLEATGIGGGAVSVSTHPAPALLIGELLPVGYEISRVIEVPSTSEAALMASRREVELALTNRCSVETYGLEFVSRTRPIEMLWSVFVSSELSRSST